MKRLILVLISAVYIPSALAESYSQDDFNDFYAGGGVNVNSVSGLDDATGLQGFAGLKLPFNWAGARHAAEVGYLTTGDFDVPGGGAGGKANGVWASYVLNWELGTNVDLLVRAGVDAGDDDGLMVGAGVELDFGWPVDLRFEIVERDNIRSLQANVVYDF